MTNLTARQIRYLDSMSRFFSPSLKFGTLISDIITQINDDNNIPITTGTPVNAVNASNILTISGVVLNGETISIGEDVYEFSTSTELEVGEGNIPVSINLTSTKASNLLTVDTNPTAGDTITIDEKVFIFVPNGTANADGEIDIESTLSNTQINIKAAVNGTDGVNTKHPTAKIVDDFTDDEVAIHARFGGTDGNSISTTETFTANTNVFSSATLAGGADCSAADAITMFVSELGWAEKECDCANVADGPGNTIIVTAKVAGVIGNDIPITETLSNGSFIEGSTLLSGGINGTVGVSGEIYKDSTYLYVCTNTNTIADKNWRRVSLGSAY